MRRDPEWGSEGPPSVRQVRLLGVVLLVVGVVVLAVPYRDPRFDLECGSPLAPRQPTAAETWDDVEAVETALRNCPGLRRDRWIIGVVGVVGGLGALAGSLRRRPGDEG